MILNINKTYFLGFQEFRNFHLNNTSTNVVAALKILSYFTMVIPAIFGLIHLHKTLCKRVSCIPADKETIISQLAKKIFRKPQSISPPFYTENSLRILNYSKKTPYPKVIITETKSPSITTLEFTFPNLTQNTRVFLKTQDMFNACQETPNHTKQVIVNAANQGLRGGGGIDGAIHKMGTTSYSHNHFAILKHLQEQRKLKPHQVYPNGWAVAIPSGNLSQTPYNIDKVVVVAGPNMKGKPTTQDKHRNALYSCYYNALLVAHNLSGVKKIIFPWISAGIFAFDKKEAASIAIRAIHDFLQDHTATSLKHISIHILPKMAHKELPYFKSIASPSHNQN